jgi:D-alanyl-D-alanine carboxypeptidase (penicillin-binding protein 5/6)
MALLVASGLLALFLFVPLGPQVTPSAVTVATSTAPNAFANVPIQATAAIVYDLVTGETLFEKNADAQLPLASLTKLLTVYAALAELSPETPITISAEATTLEMPRALNEGQTFALADLARLTLTASLNDGAAAILEATAARKNTSQAQALAGVAAALDLGQTFAVNGSGLDVSSTVSGGYGSARDLAIVAGALLSQAPDVAEATTKATASAVSAGGTAYTVKNTDPIVDSIPGLLLSKTGFTDLAGGNLVLVFDAGLGHPIAAVLLGSTAEQRFTDGSALVSATFNHFTSIDSL